jgi:hypothetical protein
MLFFFWFLSRCGLLDMLVVHCQTVTYRLIHALPQLLLQRCAALHTVS